MGELSSNRCLLGIVAIIASLCGVVNATLPSNAPYQAHGFNGIPYFHQQLIKNVRWFKIDFVYNSKDGCQTLSSWKSNLNACEPYGDLEVCCVAMRGDASGAPWLSAFFNTSYDFIDYLNSEAAVKLLTHSNSSDPVYLFMNFNSNVEGVSPMLTTALYGISQAVAMNKLNIQISPDFGSYRGSLADKCKTKGACSTEETFVNEFPWFNDDKTVNIDVSNEADQCKEGFPESTLPYRIYEPSDEDTIQNTVEAYLASDCKKPADHSTVNSLRVTSNLEPEGFQVYLGEYNSDAFLKKANKLVQSSSTKAFGRVKQDADVFISVGVENSKNVLYLYSLVDSMVFSPIFQQDLVTTTQVQGVSLNGDYFLVHYEQSSQTDLYQLVDGVKFQLAVTLKLPSTTLLSEELIGPPDAPFLGSIKMTKDGILTVAVHDINLSSGEVSPLLSEDLDLKLEIQASKLQGTSLSLIPDQEDANLIHGIITLSHPGIDGNPALYYIFIDISLANKTVDAQIPTQRSDFGAFQTTGLMYNSQSELIMLDIHTDGLCQCGQAMNNIDQDECAIGISMAYGYSVLASIRGKVNYNWGRYSDFKTAVKQGEFFNGCHPKILHAKLTTGTNPSGGIYTTKDGFSKGVFVNGSVANFEFLDSMICGRASNFDTPGVFVNSFDILNPDDFDRIL